MPTPGDQIALHLIVEHKGMSVKVSKAIFVGPDPWGPKMEAKGRAVAGVEVTVAEASDRGFDHFMLWYCGMAAQLVKNVDVECKMAEMVLSLADRGIKEGNEPKTCLACGGGKDATNFARTTNFYWMVEPTFKRPRFVSNYACINCHEKRLDGLETALDKAVKMLAASPQKTYYNALGGYLDSEAFGAEIAALVGPSALDKALVPFRNLVRDLKEGKL